MARPRTEKVRIAFDFPNREAAIEWFAQLKMEGFVPDNADVFQIDMLDTRADKGGITDRNTYIVRGEGERLGARIHDSTR